MSEGYGTGVAYVVARIKRDRPDIGERLAKGEFKDADLRVPPTPTRGRPKGAKEKPDNIRFSRKGYGTSVAAVVGRIKGVRPDIGERIGKGEFKSARAAAREAGMVGESAAVIFQGETAAWLKAEARRRGVKVAHLARDIIGAYRARGGM